MNTEFGKDSKNEFGKDFFKLKKILFLEKQWKMSEIIEILNL